MEESWENYRVENTVEKGEIAHCEQFLFFPQCLRKACTTDTQKPGFVWERVKAALNLSTTNSFLVVIWKAMEYFIQSLHIY